MTTAPDEKPIDPEVDEPAEAPDPVHEPTDEPRFPREGDDDTPEVPMPGTEESQS